MPTKIFHFALACLSPPLGAFDPFGAFDGEGLGHELGPKEGGTDGLTNGDFVGDGLGRDDGLLVGQELGQDEGGVDRVTVGSCVGNGLGRDDGVTDGAFVEIALGLDDEDGMLAGRELDISLEGKTAGIKLGSALGVLDGRTLPTRLGTTVDFGLVGCVEGDGLLDENNITFDEGKILIVGLTLGLSKVDDATIIGPVLFRNRVGVLVGCIDVGASEGRLDAVIVGTLLVTNVGTIDFVTLGALDGSVDDAIVGADDIVTLGVTLGNPEGFEGSEDGLNV
jgi:hypothetical protein